MDSVTIAVRQWAEQKPEWNTLPMSIIDRALRITKRIELAMAKFYQQIGLTPGEFEVLLALRRAGAPYCLTPAMLQSLTLLSSGAMTHRLDLLEQKGWLVRTMSQTDRRSIDVTLSEQGVCRIEPLLLEYWAWQAYILRGFSELEQDALSNQLQQWLSHYEQRWNGDFQ
ncbi:MarR family transcriptional regulator (plasmid) [Vibrio sp. HDW18]|uniref:MarR family winged helix-turn-helix transcriptional regulator n=1 Tax=Vibrio sp. HDW18 TaxID=2714948 RepID=UPI00140B95FF|nr:MarR family transcriptional regulator [Vibrio sp. HDW18]QIL86690.1 MarR family transcriptional regulator [Vibrio sp. HDW18]